MSGMAEAKVRELTDENTRLSSENKSLHSKLKLVKERRRQDEYSVLKVESILRIANNARRRAEEKLKAYKEMAYAKHSHLVEAKAELAKAKEQLARLGAHTCANPKEAAGP
ncbi:hypothetical protein Fot_24930 [Forsythia ovata]|uniref:Uncharacterized protein n=1 Tax=Forsythia ovata TaxID=205694 RepID=A0ABD1U7M7_9LAMI